MARPPFVNPSVRVRGDYPSGMRDVGSASNALAKATALADAGGVPITKIHQRTPHGSVVATGGAHPGIVLDPETPPTPSDDLLIPLAPSLRVAVTTFATTVEKILDGFEDTIADGEDTSGTFTAFSDHAYKDNGFLSDYLSGVAHTTVLAEVPHKEGAKDEIVVNRTHDVYISARREMGAVGAPISPETLYAGLGSSAILGGHVLLDAVAYQHMLLELFVSFDGNATLPSYAIEHGAVASEILRGFFHYHGHATLQPISFERTYRSAYQEKADRLGIAFLDALPLPWRAVLQDPAADAAETERVNAELDSYAHPRDVLDIILAPLYAEHISAVAAGAEITITLGNDAVADAGNTSLPGVFTVVLSGLGRFSQPLPFALLEEADGIAHVETLRTVLITLRVYRYWVVNARGAGYFSPINVSAKGAITTDDNLFRTTGGLWFPGGARHPLANHVFLYAVSHVESPWPHEGGGLAMSLSGWAKDSAYAAGFMAVVGAAGSDASALLARVHSDSAATHYIEGSPEIAFNPTREAIAEALADLFGPPDATSIDKTPAEEYESADPLRGAAVDMGDKFKELFAPGAAMVVSDGDRELVGGASLNSKVLSFLPSGAPPEEQVWEAIPQDGLAVVSKVELIDVGTLAFNNNHALLGYPEEVLSARHHIGTYFSNPPSGRLATALTTDADGDIHFLNALVTQDTYSTVGVYTDAPADTIGVVHGTAYFGDASKPHIEDLNQIEPGLSFAFSVPIIGTIVRLGAKQWRIGLKTEYGNPVLIDPNDPSAGSDTPVTVYSYAQSSPAAWEQWERPANLHLNEWVVEATLYVETYTLHQRPQQPDTTSGHNTTAVTSYTTLLGPYDTPALEEDLTTVIIF